MNNKQKILFGAIISALGLIGVLSLLTMDIELPKKVADVLNQRFNQTQIKFLILINPTIMLLLAVLFGTLLIEKTKLNAPIIKALVTRTKYYELRSIIRLGVSGGIIAGVFITTISLLALPYLPNEVTALSEKVDVTVANRLLYGGITEEILMRFGLMTTIVWLAIKTLKSQSNTIYWVGIIVSAILFGVGHFPIVFQTISEPSVFLLTYILIANSLGGIIFGWLYWKKGLEAAMIAHIVSHIVLLISNSF